MLSATKTNKIRRRKSPTQHTRLEPTDDGAPLLRSSPPPRPDTPNVDQSDPVDATIELSSDRKCSGIFVQLLLLIPQYDLPLQNVQELLLPVNLLVGRDGAPLKITA